MSGDFTFYWHDYETFGKSPRLSNCDCLTSIWVTGSTKVKR